MNLVYHPLHRPCAINSLCSYNVCMYVCMHIAHCNTKRYIKSIRIRMYVKIARALHSIIVECLDLNPISSVGVTFRVY